MFKRLKNSTAVFWILSVISILITGPLAFITLYEYINVGVLKNTDRYPFGLEGPVAGIEYYKSAELYSNRMLTEGLILLTLFGFILYFVIRRKRVGLLLLSSTLMLYIIYYLVKTIIANN